MNMAKHLTRVSSLLILAFSLANTSISAEDSLREDAEAALKSAVTFYSQEVADHGGYVYLYAEDLSRQWGEGEYDDDMIFVQPPGTPTVGMAMLRAYEVTGDPVALSAALAAGKALAAGQLKSGGWAQTIDFTPDKKSGDYLRRPGGRRNVSSLDDGQTQAAIEFLSKLDRTLEFRNTLIHETVTLALDSLLEAQFPNGGFPQVWRAPVPKTDVKQANYPEYDWRTENRIKEYWDYPTLNDGLAGTVAETLIVAHEVYKDERYLSALKRLGDFLILAQMPDPQPAWAQQYNNDMQPMWARKFEPPAISGWESQDVMKTLIRIAEYTGEMKYLEPLPKALTYFRQHCLFPDGTVARFYELKTNRPLYMDRDYQLSYDRATAPTHYGWNFPAKFDRIAEAAKRVAAGKPLTGRPNAQRLREKVQEVIRDLDDRGRWVETYRGERLTGQPNLPENFEYLSSQVFADNVNLLADFLAASEED